MKNYKAKDFDEFLEISDAWPDRLACKFVLNNVDDEGMQPCWELNVKCRARKKGGGSVVFRKRYSSAKNITVVNDLKIEMVRKISTHYPFANVSFS